MTFFAQDIPVVIIFKAYGIQSDQEIAELIGYEDDILNCFSASIEECHRLSIFTQIQVSESRVTDHVSHAEMFQALRFISTKMKSSSKQYPSAQSVRRNRVDEARELLAHIIFAHVPVGFTCDEWKRLFSSVFFSSEVIEYDYKLKAVYTASMVRRVIQAKLGLVNMDDRDYYGNKRLELAGQLIAILFEDLFKRFNTEVRLSRAQHENDHDGFGTFSCRKSPIKPFHGIERNNSM